MRDPLATLLDEAGHVTPDGRDLLVDARGRDGNRIRALDAIEGGEPRGLLAPPRLACLARLPPDARRLAHICDETGRREVQARRWLDLGARLQVSNDGGHEPIGSEGGRRLACLGGSTVMEAAVAAEDSRASGKPTPSSGSASAARAAARASAATSPRAAACS
jgi:hypothetical protein